MAQAEAAINPHALAGPALRAFFRIAGLWHLTTEEQIILLGLKRSTYFKWKQTAPTHIPRDTLERLSYILGIYKALQIQLPRSEAADTWIKRPNSAAPFGGQSALDRMLSGNVSDLFVIRQYLDAQRGM